MKKRNIQYFKKCKALKVIANPNTVDLKTFLSATFAISRSRIVKTHIQTTLRELSLPAYKLTA
jgi:hypothetical protein